MIPWELGFEKSTIAKKWFESFTGRWEIAGNMYMHVHMHMHMHMHVHVHMHMHMHMNVHMHVHMHVHLHVHLHMHMHPSCCRLLFHESWENFLTASNPANMKASLIFASLVSHPRN